MTDVQAKSLPVSLKGKDILGAARTGSGKTLCFLIPVLEILYRRRWGPQDGLGALIISPTRELVRVRLGYSLRNLNAFFDRPSKYLTSCGLLADTTASPLVSLLAGRMLKTNVTAFLE
jgi:hypothetical protein